jgi:hypothetical protein
MTKYIFFWIFAFRIWYKSSNAYIDGRSSTFFSASSQNPYDNRILLVWTTSILSYFKTIISLAILCLKTVFPTFWVSLNSNHNFCAFNTNFLLVESCSTTIQPSFLSFFFGCRELRELSDPVRTRILGQLMHERQPEHHQVAKGHR